MAEQKDKCPICGGEGKLLQYADGQREEMGCDYCKGTGEKKLDSPDREKIAQLLAFKFDYGKGKKVNWYGLSEIEQGEALKDASVIIALFNESKES